MYTHVILYIYIYVLMSRDIDTPNSPTSIIPTRMSFGFVSYQCSRSRCAILSFSYLFNMLDVRPISLLRLSLLRLLDSNIPGDPLCTREFHPL